MRFLRQSRSLNREALCPDIPQNYLTTIQSTDYCVAGKWTKADAHYLSLTKTFVFGSLW